MIPVAIHQMVAHQQPHRCPMYLIHFRFYQSQGTFDSQFDSL